MTNFSLISTTYNDRDTVRGWLASLVSQVSGGEWGIIDAGSTDGTWEVIEACARNAPQVKAVKVVREEGPIMRGDGRHLGSIIANGDILIHAIDSDVYYRKGAVETILHDFEKNNCIPTAGDSFFTITRAMYFLYGGYPALQREEDMKFYDIIKRHGHPFRTSRLNVWEEDHNDAHPLKNLALLGSKEDLTCPL